MERSPIMCQPTLQFGHYLFEADGTIAPIEWNVLDERETPDGKQKLLWSKYILESMPFDEPASIPNSQPISASSWSICSLREWLNRKFFNLAFTKEEQERILPTKTLTADSKRKNPDRVFLLSIEEFRDYFSEYKMRPQPELSPYADEEIVPYKTYWFRSSNGRDEVICDLDDDDFLETLLDPECPLYQLRGWPSYMSFGVRPAIWVQFDNETENEKGEK